jgi:hypothetical protein
LTLINPAALPSAGRLHLVGLDIFYCALDSGLFIGRIIDYPNKLRGLNKSLAGIH